MQAKEVALSPRRRRTLETNWFVALGAIEISGMVDCFPNIQKYHKDCWYQKEKLTPFRSKAAFNRLWFPWTISFSLASWRLLPLPVGHSCLHQGIDQFIHDLIDLRELPCEFVLGHLRWDELQCSRIHHPFKKGRRVCVSQSTSSDLWSDSFPKFLDAGYGIGYRFLLRTCLACS